MHPMRTILSASIAISLLALPAAAAAQSDDPRWPNPTGAVMFSGSLAEGPKLVEDISDDAGLRIGGFEEARWIEVSDARLDGRVIIATSLIGSGLGPTQDTDVLSNAIRIENDEGAWSGQPSPWFWLEDDTISNRVHVLSGEGAYDGFTALMELSGDLSATGPIDARGIIFEGPAPEPPAHPYADWQ